MQRAALLILAALALACTDCSGGSATAPPLPPPSLPAPVTAKAPTASPPSNTGLTPESIDERIRAEWKKEGIEPGPPVDDARFLRRAYLDIAGVIPPPEKVTAFLADRAPTREKRAKVVGELLADARYATHFTNLWDRILMGKAVPGRYVDRAAFRGWLRGQFEKNVPYNELVRGLVTAAGQNTAGSAAPAGGVGMAMPEMQAGAGAGANDNDNAEAKDGAKEAASVNGAVNWFLKYRQAPADLSGAVSRVFLGVQIQCAQCHDHKTEKWTQGDFESFTACFARTRLTPVDPEQDKKDKKAVERFTLRDVEQANAASPKPKKAAKGAKPAALDGTDFSESPNRRQALAAWITSPENPWFAKAIVNRMWAHFMGRGFVDPVDDLRPGNPGVMPDLLDRIAEDFEAGGYDLKRLLRLLTAIEVYHRAAAPPGAGPAKRWSRFRIEPMGTDELLDSIIAATKLEPVLDRVAGTGRDAIKLKLEQQVTFLFDVDEEGGDDDFHGTIPQALFLLNGLLVGGGTSTIPGAALSEILAMKGGDEEKIRALYLRTLAREPAADELARWAAFVREEPPKADGPKKKPQPKVGNDPLRKLANKMAVADDARGQAYEDLFWALLNSSEFVFNR